MHYMVFLIIVDSDIGYWLHALSPTLPKLSFLPRGEKIIYMELSSNHLGMILALNQAYLKKILSFCIEAPMPFTQNEEIQFQFYDKNL